MIKLSVQLYSLRGLGPIETQLRLVSDCGFHHVETTSANYASLAEFARQLDRFSLAAPSGHFGIERFRDDFSGTVQIARTLRMERLFLWGFPETHRLDQIEACRAAGQELGAIASRLADAGLQFGFHNHDWELHRLTDGRLALDHLFEGATGTPLQWQPDLAWLARGRADVAGLISTYSHMIRAAHVKDLAPEGTAIEDGWADLGAGILPWAEWLPLLAQSGADLFVLEHDEPSDPRRFLTISKAAADKLMEELQ